MPRLTLRLSAVLGPFRPAVSLILPFTLGRSLSTQSTGGPSVTRYLLRQPNSGAPRECPTPLVFIRAKGLYPSLTGASTVEGREDEEEKVWNDWSGMFAERGYTALEVDITAPSSPSPAASSGDGDGKGATGQEENSPLKAMTTLLASQIRLLAIPFPPIILASGVESGLLAQAFIEDNPASGLVLVNPPPDAPPTSLGPHDWPKFGYEGTFPILILGNDRAALEGSRVGKMASEGTRRGGKGVTVELLQDGARGDKSRYVVERWMDSCGF